MISIVNYGMGNIGSISNMLHHIGVESKIISTREELDIAERILLPGVGAFDAAISRIDEMGLRDSLIRKGRNERVPILGICLGMQLLTRSSEEGTLPGLGLIDADTLAFRGRVAESLKVPHMGWNKVFPGKAEDGLFGGPEATYEFYFVHSYFVSCDHEDDSLFTTEYGVRFDAGVRKDNVLGFQFHPEKSHRFGMRILKRFAEL